MAENSSHPNETPLESWKEIAAYLKRDVRTVKRWEKSEGLAVRRHLHQARSSVYAYPSELDAWWATRQPRLERAVPLAMPWRWPVPALGLVAVLLLALVSIGNGPFLGPIGAAAQESAGIVARQVWTGPDVNFYGLVAPSPDGRYITFVDGGSLAVRDLATGEKRHLKNPSHPNERAEFSIISPDGQQVAYEWHNKDDFDELRIMGFDGSGDRLLYRNKEMAESIRPYAWSPDGKHLVVLARLRDRTYQIAWVSVADGSLRVLRSLDWRYPFKLSLSPDGRYLVYDLRTRKDAAERDIFLLAADGSREARLIQHPAMDRHPVWAPNGKRVLFASDRTGTWGLWAIQVVEGKPQGSPELVKRDMGRILPLGFADDGSYYYGLGSGMEDVYTAEIDPVSGKVITPPAPATERFVGSNWAPVWSPDGQSLVYHSFRGPVLFGPGSLTVVIRSVKTGAERDFSSKLDLVAPLRWFPDGRSLLLAAQDNRKRVSFYRMDAQTGDISLIRQTASRSDPGLMPEPSPDGKAIFYLHRKQGDRQPFSIRVHELQSGREKEVYRVAAPVHFERLALSPDGRQVAFIVHDPSTGAEVLQIMPASGGEPRELFRSQPPYDLSNSGLEWAPDGHHVLVLRHTGRPGHEHKLWRVPTEGGEPQNLGLMMERLNNPNFHPDGRQIAFSAGTPFAVEVWVLENFLPELKAKK
ncbi:MAG: hypothetical protein ACE5HL_08180 [Terriglobia bacterium]